jgi:S-DNA-T family DNA segregation ATPase FtsK/SpoIIIE
MLEERNLKLDLFALVLLALAIFLTASLFSYDPADPPSRLVYPVHQQIHNSCGRAGAMIGHFAFEGLGVGAYYVLISLVVFDAVLLTRRRIDQPWLRLFGWMFSLVGITTLASIMVPQLSPGPAIGSGGYLGAIGRGLLEMHFGRVGEYIVSISLIGGGLLLSTDYALVHLFAWLVGKSTKGFGRGVLQVGAAYAQKIGRKRSDLDDYSSGGAVGDRVAIRIGGRTNDEEKIAVDANVVKTSKETVVAVKTPQAAEPPPAEALSVAKPTAKKAKHPDRRELIEQIEADKRAPESDDYELPSIELLLPGESFNFEEQEKEVRRRAKILEKTFIDFGLNVRVVEIQTGPVIAQFEVELEAGLRLSKITALADDLAIALRVPSVRIVAPIPGKNTVGIEVPNTNRQIVRLREVIEEANGRAQKMRIPIYLGKDVAGNPLTVDLTTLPHLLIAGRTGTGKSVCLNSIITSMIMTRRPDEVRMLMIDPKMVELSPYKSLPHLMHPVVTDMRKAEAILAWAVDKMEERYHLLARAGVRHISVYNQLGEEELMERVQPENDEERRQIPTQMPFIVIVADELADLMMTAAKEVEGHIIRLAQKSRAVGIHLVLATQKPTVDVITGLIKSNLPARISFQVASRTDSRVVLDEMGADKLLGNGDMLFLWPGTSTLIRGQGTYLSDDEINKVIAAVATSEPQFVKELVQLKAAQPEGEAKPIDHRDDMYDAAVDVVIREGRGSVSLLQRALGIGYGRAARLIDYMAEDGIVGPYNGSQAREVVVTFQQWEAMNGRGFSPEAVAETPTPAKPRRTNKITIAQPKDDILDEETESEEAPFDEDEDDAETGEMEDDFDEEDEDEEEEEDDDNYDEEDASDENEKNHADDDPHPHGDDKRWKAESA